MPSRTDPSSLAHIRRLRELILEKDKLIRMLIDLVQELSDEISEIKQQIPNSSELDDDTQ